MARVMMCEFPDDLWYDVELDVWVKRLEDNTVLLGMTDPAQTRAGKILQIRARVGKVVGAGKSVATVESGKWVGPITSPLQGKVLRLNPAVAEDPNVINRSPYEEGWIVQMEPSSQEWPQGNLLPADRAVPLFEQKLREEGLTCLRCIPSDESNPGAV
ncbi:MAG: glycine cleavage system protein H [Kyrpidia tusciae]|nr:glycine cleavage system protein H [Kyrpidia tusciae]MBE3551815.1 glycine cleavage system protein H [Kyrpidia tusciae]